MRTSLAVLVALLIPHCLPAQAVVLETVATGFNKPVDLAHCGDGRLFVVQRGGRVKVLQPDGSVNSVFFLDIASQVNSVGNEQGLLGLAFHPQYAVNGYFYVYYCTGTGNGSTRLSRFSVSANPDAADPSSEVVLWELAQPYANHNGGDLDFGPDGYLYFAPGDGGLSNDPGDRAQDLSTGFGKVHRIDVDGALPFAIPPMNPFSGADGVDTLRTILARGLRNPFRFGFDALNGDLWIGDVGQATKEEVDRIPAGASGPFNFGWRCREGTITNANVSQANCGMAADYDEPVIDHDQADGWCAVIGGRVYRGTRYPSLYGRYIYSDYCHGQLYSLHHNGSNWVSDTLTSTGAFGIACIAEDAAGELYALNTETGAIMRIIDPAESVLLRPRAYLDGPFSSGTGLMNDGMRAAGLVPALEPYTNTLGYAMVAGGADEMTTAPVLAITGNNAVVDWVRVELRPAAVPALIAASAHGLLQRDGDVVAGDGVSPLVFHVAPGDYHVAVRHRNHLAVMTAAAFALSAIPIMVDLGSPSTPVFGTGARKSGGSVELMWAGNARADQVVRYVGALNDRDRILVRVGGNTPTNTVTGYHLEDVNLDGAVRYVGTNNDRDPILLNIGSAIPTGTLRQQLP
ncbi:MAG: PQQ-dependent sugar dehydrogenase [Flavobacteriales bacterium]|nr:PQQ-dependent sugar dehydrogenase [Flavobacteriales bacterium]